LNNAEGGVRLARGSLARHFRGTFLENERNDSLSVDSSAIGVARTCSLSFVLLDALRVLRHRGGGYLSVRSVVIWEPIAGAREGASRALLRLT